METQSRIETERLWLRPPAIGNAEQIFFRYGRDPEVSRYMSWKPHRTVDDTLEFLRRITADNAAGRSCGYLMFSKGTNDLLGSVGGAIDGHRMQFGYCLARDAWGHGYASEAAHAFVEASFNTLPLMRVQAMCDVENVASARVLEKAGLKCEGTLRRYLVLPNLGDEPRDVFMYARVCGESR